jgi:rhodanese-related sulfurtransferase
LNRYSLLLLSALAGVPAWTGSAIDSAELAALLASGEKVTVVDVRSTEFYTTAHIPGAINIPAALCRVKLLPPLGRVIVYDQGLGQTNGVFAASELNKKPGITAEVLEGGMAAWETTQRQTTAGRGASREALPFIDYQTLKATTAADTILVDLRAEPSGPTVKSADAAPLTDLRAEFPGLRVTRSPFDSVSRAKAAGATPPLIVLIDRGDGKAEEMARALRANGTTRFAILAGGEEILARQGQPGLQRSGGGATVPAPVISSPATPAQ